MHEDRAGKVHTERLQLLLMPPLACHRYAAGVMALEYVAKERAWIALYIRHARDVPPTEKIGQGVCIVRLYGWTVT